MGAQSPAGLGVTPSDTSSSPIPADHAGVTDLFAVLAYGEISAFYRLSEEATLSPSLRGKVAVARMAAAELAHFERLDAALTARGADVYAAMAPFTRPLDDYHRSTDPSTWLESIVKFHVGDGIAADFYREIAGALSPDVAAVVIRRDGLRTVLEVVPADLDSVHPVQGADHGDPLLVDTARGPAFTADLTQIWPGPQALRRELDRRMQAARRAERAQKPRA